jgi:glycosyltransferase involved in cell wall biosynthesis
MWYARGAGRHGQLLTTPATLPAPCTWSDPATVRACVCACVRVPVRRGTFTEDTLGKQMLADIKAGGLAAAAPYAAYLWDDEGDGECRIVGHLNGAHWRAWTDPSPGDAPLHNSRSAHFQRSMEVKAAVGAVVVSGEVEVEPREEVEEEEEEVKAKGAAAEPTIDVAGRDARGAPHDRATGEDDTGRVYARAVVRPSALSPQAIRLRLELLRPLVSVILPIHDGEQWLDECLLSILAQTILHPEPASSDSCSGTPSSGPRPRPIVELSVFDDGSTDGTWALLQSWLPRLTSAGVRVVLGRSGLSVGGGCGFAKNRAVAQSSGEWLCFQDVDDLSLPQRIETQLAAARSAGAAGGSLLIGARVRRMPEGSTARYIAWANRMSAEQLALQRFRECTLLMPTWFLSRRAFDAAGRFREEKCEDLLFLQEHVRRGGALHRVDPVLVVYRYHAAAATHAIPRRMLLHHRAAALEAAVLSGWEAFAIWGAGRDGRDLFKALQPETRRKVTAFCDVDEKKIGTVYEFFEYRVPILHFSQATPPFITCVALDRTDGAFEANLASLGLTEGEGYYHFC